jgi:hypothetical protein
MNATQNNIPNEQEQKRKLNEALRKIRVAESFPVKEGRYSLGQKKAVWGKSTLVVRQHAKAK